MSLDADVANLARIPIFAALEPEARRLLVFSAETRILRGGDFLFRAGDRSDGGYVVLSGSIELTGERSGPATAGPFSLIGETALILDAPQGANARARMASTVIKIPSVVFRRVLAEYPASAARLRTDMAARLDAFVKALDDLRRRSFEPPKG